MPFRGRTFGLFLLGSAACVNSATAPALEQPTRVPAKTHAAAAPAPVTSPPATVDDAFVAVPRLLDDLNEARSSHGSRALSIDSVLSHIAAAAVKSAIRLGRGSEQRIVNDTNAQLARFSLVYRRVAAAVVFTPALDEALGALTPGLDPAMNYTGIAVEPVPSFGAGYAVVVIVGE
jgi:hypothetical protein